MVLLPLNMLLVLNTRILLEDTMEEYCTHYLTLLLFLAAIKLLDKGEMILTHDIYVSVLRPVSVGSKVVLTGKVIQNGKTVVFLESEAHVGGKLVASAKVTKTRSALAKL
eukprot:TRINITY_DN3298_c0_g1_i1.p1 TRINITY_DN3298_c0_g1~~TRINITY_DN3298_c0_g1_i1.p1  ORF type:complete len:110 (-),score=17.28 TRINITY_DN3298_c0_g1_i1:198-527(-)